MDHMLELARHPDVLEALELSRESLEPSPARSALDQLLSAKRHLASEWPNVWVTEVLHEFYAHPDLAAAVWVKLRYCRSFRQELADRQLREAARHTRRWPFSTRRADAPEPESYAARYRADRRKAVRDYAHQLDAQPEVVRQICSRENAYPEPPAFIADLLDSGGRERRRERRDQQIRELLANPLAVRALAANAGTPVPFSIVQEEELRQICRTRQELRPAVGAAAPAGPAPPPTIAGTRTLDEEVPEQASYAGPLDDERVRRAQWTAQRKAMAGAQQEAAEEVLRQHAGGDHPRYSGRVAHDMNLFGLAFSGGGIRSATFNLGVLQGLSRIGLLPYVDYLSTVSGGGYIGSWLAAWIRRELDDRPAPPAGQQAAPAAGHEVMRDIQRRLSPVRSPNPLDERLRPIRFLREYSNYLTPRTGFFSADTWTMIGIYLRNTLLNQVIIAAVFAAILLAPRNWVYAIGFVLSASWVWEARIALWGLSTGVLIMNLRQLDPRDAAEIVAAAKVPGSSPVPPRYARPWVVHAFVVLPWLLTAALVAQPLGEWALHEETLHYRAAAWVAVVVAATLGIVLLLGRADRCWRAGGSAAKGLLIGGPTIAASAIVSGAVAGFLWWLFIALLPDRASLGSAELRWHLTALGTPVLIAALSLAIVAMLGILGERFPDEHREWWSRLRTMLHVYAAGWLVWFLAAVYVPWGFRVLLEHEFGSTWSAGALVAWAASTLLGVRKGPQAEAAHKREAELKISASMATVALRWATFAAPYVFVVGLVTGLSLAIDALYARWAPRELPAALASAPLTTYWTYVDWTTTTCWIWLLAAVAVALVLSWRVDINEFSIHHFYKNRLVRCYLGASHTRERKPDWFTGFDPKDDLPLQRFDRAADTAAPEYAGPYPIVNCALNLVAGKDLAWQERKATSFTFTPKYCGFDVDRSVLTKDRDQHSEGFVPTRNFYNQGQGPLLGMAMAISGAAANPSMGRASSPALGFLMTVFNVRLGWWMGNPRHRTGKLWRSPPLGLVYTLVELLGLTDDTRRFVNLSDGGHFDNLGVYELIRRNCRYIVVCDAGHDDRFLCEDLGALVRRCRVDFGVEIDIAVDRLRQRDAAGRSPAHCVVGRIDYLNMPHRRGGVLKAVDGQDLAPGGRPAHEFGYLVYIKPTLTGDEPQDVLEYARRVTSFPHQSTADQWFGESQFESYRALGMHIAERTFSRHQADDANAVRSLDDLFEQLYRHWHPPAPVINERSTEHTAEYSRIMELVRSTPALQGLDGTLFDALAAGAPLPLAPRDEFYVCNALIQLMENVYADLDLENNYGHPHVMGWRRVFESWAARPAFERTWQKSRATYAERFARFYEDRLRARR